MRNNGNLALLLLLAAFSASAQQRPGGDFDVNGRVLNDLTGEVLHKASIELFPTTQRTQPQHFDVGPDGAFEFHHVAPGKYSLVGRARGFPPQAFEQHGQFSTAIVVAQDRVSTGVIFRLHPEGSILGRILDEHNEPVRNAQVMLFEKSTDTGTRMVELRSQGQTEDDGEYHFNHLRAGIYYLAVTAQPWYRRYLAPVTRKVLLGQTQAEIDPALDSAYPVVYYPGATDPGSAGAIVVHAGDRITANFDLAPVQSLHLTLRHSNADGTHPVYPQFRQRVFGTPSGFLQPTVMGGQEDIEISGIAPGDYELQLGQQNGKENTVRNQDLTLQGDAELDGHSGGVTAAIHGQIKFDGPRTPQNPFIELREVSSGRPMGARVDEHGEFNVQSLHAGRYVVALGNAPGYAIRTISAMGAKASGRTVEFTGSQPAELVVDASEGVARIDGTVISGDKPASGAMVVLVPQEIADNLTLFRRDQSDSDGTFTLSDVVPGRYTAVAINNGWDMEWASPETLRPYLAKGTSVQVAGKQQIEIKVAAQ